MKTYPALDVTGISSDLLLAAVDDFSPTALEEHDSTLTVYFTDGEARQRAFDAVRETYPSATLAVRDVDDGDWARRSQENLTPIQVGRITVVPPWHASRTVTGVGEVSETSPSPTGVREVSETSPTPTTGVREVSETSPTPTHELVIAPSMGFGTGHHATTRLCLAALQALPLDGRTVLDVGTGSGVLALAARLLGARDAVGLDNDADAIQSAEENLAANPAIDRVLFVTGDLRTVPLEPADIVTANLTGALLVQAATLLRESVTPGGTLIVAGLLREERGDVVNALSPARIVWEDAEEPWVAMALNISRTSTV